MTEKSAANSPKPTWPHTVRGRIIHPDVSPIAGEHVQAYAKRLRCDEPLGKPARSDRDGRYRIEYDPDKRPVDLYVPSIWRHAATPSGGLKESSAALLGRGADPSRSRLLCPWGAPLPARSRDARHLCLHRASHESRDELLEQATFTDQVVRRLVVRKQLVEQLLANSPASAMSRGRDGRTLAMRFSP